MVALCSHSCYATEPAEQSFLEPILSGACAMLAHGTSRSRLESLHVSHAQHDGMLPAQAFQARIADEVTDWMSSGNQITSEAHRCMLVSLCTSMAMSHHHQHGGFAAHTQATYRVGWAQDDDMQVCSLRKKYVPKYIACLQNGQMGGRQGD